ncbi:trypsin-like serine protease with C-terminal PDZ domain [Belliella baltica DSM 15883]|uniref:Trypsin-like serine protease with C-terminal PDZ domain n=1 Tax=Belliella baltica (strain DSM 15883 / CIP 108006 / LMG 21964 / BA134) TaxID=866536 RepID=I3Z527_BELBD|nr:trypsin-like peptidase domain-containing protein [Belliella baltica]AFL84345.1 trypsin-like serine protease with C-terminal PDZ domain [Belliella baltica DSM 15883]
MNKKQFFLGIILASLIGGIVALAGVSYLSKQNTATTFSEKQDTSFVNWLSNDKFTVPDGINFVAAAELVTPAVVHVKSSVTVSQRQRGSDPFEELFGFRSPERNQMPREARSSGSGVIISEDGYIVTNNHVIENATKVEISLENNTRYTARVIGTDPTTDLALLKIEKDGLPFVRFGNSDETNIGEWVLAVGNPFDLTSTVTAGIISAKARNIGILRTGENDLSIESFLQTDAVVNPGNSGGALVNLAGELIGINTAIASRTGTFNGYAFAVPSSIVNKVVDDLLKYGTVQRGLLGVTIIDVSPELIDQFELDINVSQGVYVNGVNEGSGGADAGLQKGDIIIGVDGVSTNSVAKLQEMVARKRPGDQVSLKYLRDGKEEEVKATLKNISGDTKIVKKEVPVVLEYSGVTFEDLKSNIQEKLNIQGGASILSVDNKEWEKSGARPGFIITSIIGSDGRYRISNANDVIQILGENKGEEIVILGLYPNGQEYYFEVTVE